MWEAHAATTLHDQHSNMPWMLYLRSGLYIRGGRAHRGASGASAQRQCPCFHAAATSILQTLWPPHRFTNSCYMFYKFSLFLLSLLLSFMHIRMTCPSSHAGRRKRRRTSGFRARLATKAGRKVLKGRRKRGRHSLAPASETASAGKKH